MNAWKKIIRKLSDAHYVYNDTFALVGAAYISREWPGDPLWLMCVGPPGSGKTCSAMLYRDLEAVTIESHLTPASLITVHGGPANDRSLMARVNNQLVVFKDFGTILTTNWDAMRSILATLREAYDGHISKEFAMLTRSYDVHFNVVAVCTEAADLHLQLAQLLGERMLRVDIEPSTLPWPPPEISEMAPGFVAQWIEEVDARPPDRSPPKEMGDLATFVAKLRTEIIHDYRTHEITDIPRFEQPTRLAKQFSKLYSAVERITEDRAMVERLVRLAAKSCIPRRRTTMLSLIARKPGITNQEIALISGLGPTVVRMLTQDLKVLGFVAKEKGPHNVAKWKLVPEVSKGYKLLIGEL